MNTRYTFENEVKMVSDYLTHLANNLSFYGHNLRLIEKNKILGQIDLANVLLFILNQMKLEKFISRGDKKFVLFQEAFKNNLYIQTYSPVLSSDKMVELKNANITKSTIALPKVAFNKTNRQLHNYLKVSGFFNQNDKLRKESFERAVNYSREEYRTYLKSLNIQ